MPNVVNQTLNDAEIMIQEKDMLIQIVDQVESDTIPKGAVLSQNIPYGTEVKGGNGVRGYNIWRRRTGVYA